MNIGDKVRVIGGARSIQTGEILSIGTGIWGEFYKVKIKEVKDER